MKVVCTQKTLAIDFDNFPDNYHGHEELNDLIVKAIPECTELDGGFYRQTRSIWINIDCNDLTEERDKEIQEIFLTITQNYLGGTQ